MSYDEKTAYTAQWIPVSNVGVQGISPFNRINVVASDNVNSPIHYNRKGIECIQAIEASMSNEEFQGYLKGNFEKYVWRYKYKGKPLEDLKKAQWYLNKLIGIYETSQQ